MDFENVISIEVLTSLLFQKCYLNPNNVSLGRRIRHGKDSKKV